MYKKYFLLLFIVIFLFQLSSFGQKIELTVNNEYIVPSKRYGIGINYYFNQKIRLGYNYQYFNKVYWDHPYDRTDRIITPSIHIHEISFPLFFNFSNNLSTVKFALKPTLYLNIGKNDILTKHPYWGDLYSIERVLKISSSLSVLFLLNLNNIFDTNFSISCELSAGFMHNPVVDFSQYDPFLGLSPFARIGFGISYTLNPLNKTDK